MKKQLLGLILAVGFLVPALAEAKIVGHDFEYQDGKDTMQGYLVYDDASKGKVPGILMTPDWLGIRPLAKSKADDLAKLGYVVLAVDAYGKDVRPKDAKEAMEIVGKYKGNRPLFRKRMEAAYAALSKQKNVDTSRLAAIGFCFGGTASLELARDGANLKSVVTFHGGLDNPTPADAKNIKAKVLVLHGADDPFVKEAEVSAFKKEMREAKVDWQLHEFSGAVHSFTITDAGNDNSKGAAYNEKAATRAWAMMQQFFKETL